MFCFLMSMMALFPPGINKVTSYSKRAVSRLPSSFCKYCQLPYLISHGLEKLFVNGKYKVIAKCQTFIKRYKQTAELWKIIRLTRFQKPPLQSVTIFFQISLSEPSFFIFSLLIIPSLNVLSSYLYVSRSLVEVRTV